MARRGGFERALRAASREISRQARLAEQQRKRDLRERASIAREQNRTAAQEFRLRQMSEKEAAKERKAAYLVSREYEEAALNSHVAEVLEALSSILRDTLHVNDAIQFDSLRIKEKFTPPRIPKELSTEIAFPDWSTYFSSVKRPGRLAMALLPWVKARFERETAEATERARSDMAVLKDKEQRRLEKVAEVQGGIERSREEFALKVAMRDEEVDAFESDYDAGEPDALVAYFSMVLEQSEYPEGFPQNFSVAFQAESKQLVVEYELPSPDIVPTVEQYKYTRSRDTIDERPRKPSSIKGIYADVVAAVVLRTLHEVFESDTRQHLEAVCVNAYVNSVDPATGRDIKPYLVSVRTTREKFLAIDLSRVDKAVCLKNLGANVSRSPEEVQAVKPIVDFKMADARFIDQSDLVSSLSDAVNLMDLNPYEFEQLVANLFEKMGLASKLTRSSRDGGVDCIAFDPRPVLGGKVVIQAKRYRHTVGVSAVRDLYGTMMNEGASKGLLVTTSGYGPDAFNFAQDKPIELIDGGGLLYLLDDIGVSARIIMPEG